MDLDFLAKIDPVAYAAAASKKPDSSASAGGVFRSKLAQAAQAAQTRETGNVQELSLESMLKAKYPGLVFHVLDATSPDWQRRNDYPHHLLFQEQVDPSEIENWKASGPNKSQLDPTVQRNLSSIPPGRKSVVIHPKIIEKMEQDPRYAEVLMKRIDAWFTFDILRNEAIIPGSTANMAQCVVIGEDGQIANVCSVSPPRITGKFTEEDNEESFWTKRMKLHAYYNKLWQEEQFERIDISSMMTRAMARQAAAMQLSQLLQSSEFRSALGETVAGMPAEDLISMVQAEIGAAAVVPTGIML